MEDRSTGKLALQVVVVLIVLRDGLPRWLARSIAIVEGLCVLL